MVLPIEQIFFPLLSTPLFEVHFEVTLWAVFSLPPLPGSSRPNESANCREEAWTAAEEEEVLHREAGEHSSPAPLNGN